MLALCVGMYRACSTWQYGVVGAILERHRAGTRLGFVEGIRAQGKLDESRYAAGWGVLKAHDAHERFAALLRSGRAVGFYAHRDLRDVVASYSHKTGTDREALLERGFVELCLRNDRFWREQPGVLVQRYDALIADPAAGVRQIAAHLGVDLAPGEAEAVAATLSWDANRRRVEALAARLRADGAALVAADQSRFDPVSLLHWNHIRAAEPARSARDAGTPRQRRLVEQAAGPWLAEQGYAVPAPSPDDPAEPTPALRTSHAPGGTDVRLDRLFRGTRGTAIDFDAPSPGRANPTYYLYLRGWQTTSIGTTGADRGEFVRDRPHDLNLACQPGPGHLAGLIAGHPIADPDLVAIGPAADADLILGVIAATAWRPQAYVIDQPAPALAPTWPGRLAAAGYAAVPDLVGPQVFVRADLAGSIPDLARPLGPADHYRTAAAAAGAPQPDPADRDDPPTPIPTPTPTPTPPREPRPAAAAAARPPRTAGRIRTLLHVALLAVWPG